MADLYLGESTEPEAVSASGIVGALFNWAGAMMSVALVGGLGMWGYQLAVRDVTGVPVVRALEGPMRVAPDDPGGEQAQFQGLAVNSVAAEGGAAGPVDKLVLAPPPTDLTVEDLPAPGRDAPAEEDGIAALADELSEGATPLAAPSDIAVPSAEAIPETVRGVKRSPLPVPRPVAHDAVAEEIAMAVDLSASLPGAVEVAPQEVMPGTRLVQFGAFASVEEARAEWDRLDQRFTDFFLGKQRVIEKAVSGGKTFYRLRAMGFTDVSDARRFCSAFVADRQACIPVVAR